MKAAVFSIEKNARKMNRKKHVIGFNAGFSPEPDEYAYPKNPAKMHKPGQLRVRQ